MVLECIDSVADPLQRRPRFSRNSMQHRTPKTTVTSILVLTKESNLLLTYCIRNLSPFFMAHNQMATILRGGRSLMEASRRHIVQLKIPRLPYALSGLPPLVIPYQSVEPPQARPALKFGNDKGVFKCIHNLNPILICSNYTFSDYVGAKTRYEPNKLTLNLTRPWTACLRLRRTSRSFRSVSG